MRTSLRLSLALSALLFSSLMTGCGSSGGANNPPPPPPPAGDMTGEVRDLSTDPTQDPPDMAVDPGTDMRGVPPPDLQGNPADMRTPPADMAMTPPDLFDPMGGTCSPGSYRCGPANSVQICNSSGSAWLHSSTCAVSCVAGLCTGACKAGSRRCNASAVEECNTAGTAWTSVETCSVACSSGVCALDKLDVTMSRTMQGEIVVQGDFTIRSGVTVTADTGELTIRAKNITVENAATLTAAPKGNSQGAGGTGSSSSYPGGGGGYGSGGAAATGASGGSAFGSNTDVIVEAGGNGGASGYGQRGGRGGGILRLIAEDTITVSGFVTANGEAGQPATTYSGGGGGAGGGILLAAGGNITIGGTVSAAGGAGAPVKSYYPGGNGGNGRVKILGGGRRTITGTVTGNRTDGLLPPLLITSSSHPDQTLIYNDDFDQVQLSWVAPFSSRQGYYHLINTAPSQVPTPMTATFVNTEASMYPRTSVVAGSNYFHIVPIDAMSSVGTVENSFRIQVNTTPPTVSSTSHTDQTKWSTNQDAFFSWSFPVADQNVKGVYYVLDNYGETVPTKAATLVPLPQKTLLRSMIPSGIWVMHVVAVDQRDYLTKAAGHYRVNIGTDPGTGAVLGQVNDAMGKPVDSAQISINRGLFSATTNTTGNFNFPKIPAGMFEIRATKSGRTPVTQTISVTKDGSTTANLTMP